MRGFRSFYYTYTYLYLLDRINYNRFVPIDDENKILSGNSRKAISKNNIFSPETTPHSKPRGVVRGENTIGQVLLESSTEVDSPVNIRAWHCLVMEKEAGRKWIVKCSDDAFPDSEFGWVCDCGNWTFGDDDFHAPIFSRIIGKVVNGRVWSCRR